MIQFIPNEVGWSLRCVEIGLIVGEIALQKYYDGIWKYCDMNFYKTDGHTTVQKRTNDVSKFYFIDDLQSRLAWIDASASWILASLHDLNCPFNAP